MYAKPSYSKIETAPSGAYSFGVPDHRQGYETEPVVQVIDTPARYYASTIAELGDGADLAIDFGARWSLGQTDTAAFRAYAQRVLAQ